MIKLEPIHTHDIITWQKCQRLFFFSSERYGLGYQPAGLNKPIEIGNLWHRTAELYNSNIYASWEEAAACAVLEAKVILFPSTAGPCNLQPAYASWTEMVGLFAAMIEGYQLWQEATAKDFYSDDNLTYIPETTEYEWEIQSEHYNLSGKIDQLVRDQTGLYWVLEHKTTGNPSDLIASLAYAWQPRIYTWAARKLWPDKPIAGVLYNVVGRTNPWEVKKLSRPANRAGLPSKAQNELNNTTLACYQELLNEWLLDHPTVEREQILEEYAGPLAYLGAQEYPLYFRYPLRVTTNQAALEQQLSNLYGEIMAKRLWFELLEQEIACAPPALNGHPRFGHCLTCPFAGVCQLADTGGNYRELLEAAYRKESGE